MGATCCAPETPTANLGPHNPYANISLVTPTSSDYPAGTNPPINPYFKEHQYDKVQAGMEQSHNIDPGMSPNMPFMTSPANNYSANISHMQSSVMTTRLADASLG
jgi:hypothetical protein